MNEVAALSLGFGIVGGVIGYFLTKEVIKNVGVPVDERGIEISKLAAAKTLEFLLLVLVVSLYYCLIVAGNRLCSGILSMVLALAFFGNLALKAYYSRKL